MAEQGKSDDLVTLQELAVSNTYEIAALMAVLERKGILTHADVLDEIARRKRGTAVADDIPGSLGGFETWPLRRVAQSVKAGEGHTLPHPTRCLFVVANLDGITDAGPREPLTEHLR